MTMKTGKVMEINERLRAVAPVRKDSLKKSVGFVVYGSKVNVWFSLFSQQQMSGRIILNSAPWPG
jgi:hypothetical protein